MDTPTRKAESLMDTAQPEISVFTPWPIFTVTIERGADGRDQVYFHAGGQGFWVARMVASLGCDAVLCGPFGGETGHFCAGLIEAEGVRLRQVPVTGWNGGYIHDRREGDRREVADVAPPTLNRHEIDDFYNAGLAEGLRCGTVVLTGEIGESILPAATVARLASDLARNDVCVVADVSGAVLDALEPGLSVLKISHEELMDSRLCEANTHESILPCMRELARRLDSDVVVSRAEDGALALVDGRIYEMRLPPLDAIDHSGAGDSMTAALAVARARGLPAEEQLRLASAAGALNATRHGRGTGARPDIEELARHVDVRPLEEGGAS